MIRSEKGSVFCSLQCLFFLSEWRYSIMKRENMLCMTESLKWNISVLCSRRQLAGRNSRTSETERTSKGKLLALAFAGTQASFPKKMPTIDELQQTAKWMYRYRPKQYEMLENAFCAVWDDLVCFPVKCRVSYEDSWMEERTYGGKRGMGGRI